MEAIYASVSAAMRPVIFSIPSIAASAQKPNMIIRKEMSRDRMA